MPHGRGTSVWQGNFPAEALIEHQSQRINVRSAVDDALDRPAFAHGIEGQLLFGRHIGRRTAKGGGRRPFRPQRCLGKMKVKQHGLRVGGQQHVGGFDIQVDKPAIVSVSERVRQAGANPTDRLLIRSRGEERSRRPVLGHHHGTRQARRVEAPQHVTTRALGRRHVVGRFEHALKGSAAQVRHAQNALAGRPIVLNRENRNDMSVLQPRQGHMLGAAARGDFQDHRPIRERRLRREKHLSPASRPQGRQDAKVVGYVRRLCRLVHARNHARQRPAPLRKAGGDCHRSLPFAALLAKTDLLVNEPRRPLRPLPQLRVAIQKLLRPRPVPRLPAPHHLLGKSRNQRVLAAFAHIELYGRLPQIPLWFDIVPWRRHGKHHLRRVHSSENGILPIVELAYDSRQGRSCVLPGPVCWARPSSRAGRAGALAAAMRVHRSGLNENLLYLVWFIAHARPSRSRSDWIAPSHGSHA